MTEFYCQKAEHAVAHYIIRDTTQNTVSFAILGYYLVDRASHKAPLTLFPHPKQKYKRLCRIHNESKRNAETGRENLLGLMTLSSIFSQHVLLH